MPTFNALPAVPYLSDEDFTTGQSAWNKLVQIGDSEALSNAFALPEQGAGRVGGFSFPIESIKQLLSAVAVRYVQVHFVLLPDTERFAVVCTALDKDSVPLTAYYGPGKPTPAPTLATLGSPRQGSVGTAVPPVLATDWIHGWHGFGPLTKDLFISADQTLEGYKFEVESVLQALFAAGSSETLELLLGAHQYYGPGYDGKPTSKFGVILATLASDGTGPTNTAEDTFFDMCMPCPPY